MHHLVEWPSIQLLERRKWLVGWKAKGQEIRAPVTVSLRVDKMVERGLVERRADPTDARATLVQLTAVGQAAFDRVALEHLANEARLVAALSDTGQGVLGELLKSLLVDIEQPDNNRPDEALGMRVASATRGQQRRAAVGLPLRKGLLIEMVRSDGFASRAGLLVGDLITAANTTSVYGLTALAAALKKTRRHLVLTVERNGEEISVILETVSRAPRRRR